MTTEQRRLAAIVSADVAGYSRLMGRDESGTLAALKALRREVVDPRIAKHNGRIVKTTGDGLLLEFASVVDAVRCVIEVQTAMAEKTADVPEDRRIAFRIGVNIGDIIIDGDDIFGDGVNVAARLQEIAPPGGVCVSSRVHDDVRDRLDTTFDGRSARRHSRTSLDQSRSGAGRPARRARPRPPPPTALAAARQAVHRRAAVPEHERRSRAGVLRRRHGRGHHHRSVAFPALFVIARNSSFTYKGQAVDVKQVGRELGVRYVLEGSIRDAGKRVRITAQLIDAPPAHLWAERYDGALADIFDIQDEVTAQIVAAIDFEVREAEAQRSRGMARLEAWRAARRPLPCCFA